MKEQQITGKGRDPVIDILKGIAIILVVVGHIPYTPWVLRAWIYTFHVPLFFACSGMLFSLHHYPRFCSFLLSRARGLLLPILTLGILARFLQVLLSFLISLIPGAQPGYAIPPDPLHTLLSLLAGNRVHEYYYSFWFLYALFLAEILFYFLVKFLKNRWYVYLILVFAGIALQYLVSLHVQGFYWSLDLLPAALSFLSAGYLYRILFQEKKKRMPLFLLPVMLLCSLFFCVLNIRILQGDQVNLFYGTLGNPAVYLASALSGICMCIILAERIRTSAFLEFFGRHSLVTYAFQNPVAIPLMMEILFFLGLRNRLFEDPVFCWIFTVFGTLLLSAAFSLLIARFAPWLIGKKKTKGFRKTSGDESRRPEETDTNHE